MAAALTSGDFGDINLRGSTPADAEAALTEITEPMGESSRTVSVQSVAEIRDAEPERRAVTFDVTWDLDYADEPWSYTTTAEMELVDEQWQADWNPALLHPDVGAKTGTAEYGTENPPATHGWMIAIRGDPAVAAFVEDAESPVTRRGRLILAPTAEDLELETASRARPPPDRCLRRSCGPP